MNKRASSQLLGASVLVLAATAHATVLAPVIELSQNEAGETSPALLQAAGEGG